MNYKMKKFLNTHDITKGWPPTTILYVGTGAKEDYCIGVRKIYLIQRKRVSNKRAYFDFLGAKRKWAYLDHKWVSNLNNARVFSRKCDASNCLTYFRKEIFYFENAIVSVEIIEAEAKINRAFSDWNKVK